MRGITPELDFLYLLVETANVGVVFCWHLVKFHDADHRILVILQNPIIAEPL